MTGQQLRNVNPCSDNAVLLIWVLRSEDCPLILPLGSDLYQHQCRLLVARPTLADFIKIRPLLLLSSTSQP